MTDLIQAAAEAADLIDLDVLASIARGDQIEAIASARDSFTAYWAGSITASVVAHAEAGAIKTVEA